MPGDDLGSTNDQSGATLHFPPVMLVPGIVNPVDISYAPLIEQVEESTHLVLKELEVYRAERVPEGYNVGTEVEAIRRAADGSGLGRFHLVGYSAGGLAALGFIDRYPNRLLSVALIEQFGTGSYDTDPAEHAFLDRTATVLSLPAQHRVQAFLPMTLSEGVTPPPPIVPGPPPDWTALRPAGISALIRAAIAARFNRTTFKAFRQPVYVAYGSLSDPVWGSMAGTLRALFSNIHVEVYEGLHHLTPPQRTEPERLARALHALWAEAEVMEKEIR